MIGFLLPYVLVFIAGAVVGALVARKHPAEVEKAVNVVTDVADKVK